VVALVEADDALEEDLGRLQAEVAEAVARDGVRQEEVGPDREGDERAADADELDVERVPELLVGDVARGLAVCAEAAGIGSSRFATGARLPSRTSTAALWSGLPGAGAAIGEPTSSGGSDGSPARAHKERSQASRNDGSSSRSRGM